jgi:ABC-type multidrug transport system fused ATPase/permease subunit
MALLEELKKTSGTLDIQGSVFYISQEPWIFTASLRQNIMFCKPYNKEKYDEIIKVCCLEQDIETFKNGDKTLIGEKGIGE